MWLDLHISIDNTTTGGKNQMENYIQAKDYELWMNTVNGPYILVKFTTDGKTVSKEPKEFDSDDFRKMEKNAKAKKLLYFGLGSDEYTRISECESTKEIWNALQIAHEGANQVKQPRIKLLVRKYELFEMSNKETVMDMYTQFTHITNKLKSLGKSFTIEELVRKILWILPQSWESKVNAIQEAKNMNEISLDELIGNLQTYELRRNSQIKEEVKKNWGLALKAGESDSSDFDEEGMAIITRKFKKFFKKAKSKYKSANTSKTKSSDRDQFLGCFKCGRQDHVVKNFPLLKEEHGLEQDRTRGKKAQLTNGKKQFIKAMMAAWGDTSEEE